MKSCNCGAAIPATLLVDGKRRNLANRKYCLTCVPFGTKSRKHTAGTGKTGVCKRCEKEFFYIGKGVRTVCNTCMVNKRRPERKAWAVAHKGGGCLLCGYSACLPALDFHHTDPSEKELSISSMYLLTLERFKDELRKCVLLCCRCHAEVHAGLVSHEELVARERHRLAQLDGQVSEPN